MSETIQFGGDPKALRGVLIQAIKELGQFRIREVRSGVSRGDDTFLKTVIRLMVKEIRAISKDIGPVRPIISAREDRS